jgi:hypothetical protein
MGFASSSINLSSFKLIRESILSLDLLILKENEHCVFLYRAREEEEEKRRIKKNSKITQKGKKRNFSKNGVTHDVRFTYTHSCSLHYSHNVTNKHHTCFCE